MTTTSTLKPCTFTLLIDVPGKNSPIHIEGEIEFTGDGYVLNAFPSPFYRRWFTMPIESSTSYSEIAQLIRGAVAHAS